MASATADDPINKFPQAEAKPLRFKSTQDTSKRRERDRRYDSHRSRHHHKRRRRHGDDSKHTHRNESAKDPPGLDPDAAFRESLFDAMADDEGADYWESVYGQPIHDIPQERMGPDGELERMTDEEYVEHVRAEMWKKTNAGLLEERERMAKARKEAEARDREAREIRERLAREDYGFQQRVDASLRKGRRREEARKNKEVWLNYQKAWEELGEGGDDDAVVEVPWPTLCREKSDPTVNEVEAFMRYAADLGGEGGSSLASILKSERVRWHPDKVQQRAKGRLDESSIRKVTAVFQIIDDLFIKHKK